METGELKQIAQWLTEAGVALIEITGPRGSVRVTAAGMCAANTVGTNKDGAAEGRKVDGISHTRATTVGIFLDAHPLRQAPFVRIGDAVKAGDVVGLIKIGRIYAPLAAPSDGIVSRLLVEPGAPVDFGKAILEIKN